MFVQSLGALSLATRIKLLSDRLYAQVDEVYRARGVEIESRWFVLLRLLLDRGPLSTTAIANAIGTTHPAVSQLGAKIEGRGLVQRKRDPRDERKTLWTLTATGRKQLEALGPLWEAMQSSVEATIDRSGHDLLAALAAFEAQLSTSDLKSDMLQRHARLAANEVRIVPFRRELREHFYRLNAEWVVEHFRLEPEDERVLSQPESQILGHGGRIFFAMLGNEVIGTTGLERERKGVYAVIKMSVAKPYRGLGIGRALLERTIEEFERLQGTELFLETNSKLTPALQLYESVGFVRQPMRRSGTAFERSDVYMIYDPGKRRASAPDRPTRDRLRKARPKEQHEQKAPGLHRHDERQVDVRARRNDRDRVRAAGTRRQVDR
jgi:DNA-binding MarR family transcriptional regulator/ribosomal protein S18 acetylase RimI-like enzyme